MTDQKQIFCECSKLCDDPFWAQQFTNIITNRSPKGIFINKTHVVCSRKGREFSYDYTNKSTEVIKDGIISLFKSMLNIRSPNDRDAIKDRISILYGPVPVSSSDIKWTSLRSKNDKEHAVYMFAKKIAAERDMSVVDRDYLFKRIMAYISTKEILSIDIKFDNRSIGNIEGLEFNNDNTFYIKKKIQKKRWRTSISGDSPEQTVEEKGNIKKIMSTKWQPYVRKGDLK